MRKLQRKKYVVITGASSGIGMEFARRFARKGYPLVLIARREERLRSLAGELRTDCEIIVADLSREEECYRVFYELKEKPVAFLINNAGFGDCGLFEETRLQKDLDMIQVNVKAVHILMKLMLQKMEKEHHGYILNVASSAGLMPGGPYMATYYASKAFVQSFSQAIHVELRRAGVHVSALCPGPVRTAFWENADAAHTPISRVALDAPFVASEGFNALCRNKALCVPGALAKTIVFATRLAPRGFVARTAAALQRPRKRK